MRRALRRALDWGRERTYDGAQPPPRLVDEVRAFRILNPLAGAEEWEAFALALAASAWRDGYDCGVEWRERAGDVAYDRALLTEAERRAREWTLWEGHPTSVEMMRRRFDPADPLAGVPPERRREVLAQLEAAAGHTYRFVDDAGRPILDLEDDDESGRGGAGAGERGDEGE